MKENKTTIQNINSLRFRIPIIIFIIIISSQFVFTYFAYVKEEISLTEEYKLSFNQILSRVSNNMTHPLWNFNTVQIEKIIKLEIIKKEVSGILIYDDSGEFITGFVKDKYWKVTEFNSDEPEHQKVLYASYLNDEQKIIYNDEIQDNEIGFVRLYFTDSFIRSTLSSMVTDYIFQAVILSLVIFIVIFFIILQFVLKPIMKLENLTMEISKGNLKVKASINSKDEFQLLEKFMLNMTFELNNSMKQITKEAKEKALMSQELDTARSIQKALLPGNFEYSNFEIAAKMITATEVGGDYFDVIFVEGYEWFIIGDVSGHGLSAGLIMMMVQTAVRTAINLTPQILPSDLLSVVNKVITRNIRKLGDSMFMTIVAVTAYKSGNFYFSGMHLPLLIYRAAEQMVEEIDTDGMWIAIIDDISEMNTNKTFTLSKGDCLILYTDGIIEAAHSVDTEQLFDIKNLKTIIQQNGSQKSSVIIDKIINSLKEYNINDDVCALVIKRKD